MKLEQSIKKCISDSISPESQSKQILTMSSSFYTDLFRFSVDVCTF